MKARRWFVLTPAGSAGPYRSAAEAKAAAQPFGWQVLSVLVDVDEEARC